MSKCLIVVDYQGDFVDGSLGFPGAERLAEPIAAKIDAYRTAGDTVVFTLDTHGADYLQTQEGRHLPAPHCLEGTPGHGLYGRVAEAARDSDRRFVKATFGSDALFDYLRRQPFDAIELCGLVSNICVLSNAVLAKTAQPETPLLVDARCTASHDARLNQATLDILQGLHIQVTGLGEP